VILLVIFDVKRMFLFVRVKLGFYSLFDGKRHQSGSYISLFTSMTCAISPSPPSVSVSRGLLGRVFSIIFGLTFGRVIWGVFGEGVIWGLFGSGVFCGLFGLFGGNLLWTLWTVFGGVLCKLFGLFRGSLL